MLRSYYILFTSQDIVYVDVETFCTDSSQLIAIHCVVKSTNFVRIFLVFIRLLNELIIFCIGLHRCSVGEMNLFCNQYISFFRAAETFCFEFNTFSIEVKTLNIGVFVLFSFEYWSPWKALLFQWEPLVQTRGLPIIRLPQVYDLEGLGHGKHSFSSLVSFGSSPGPGPGAPQNKAASNLWFGGTWP